MMSEERPLVRIAIAVSKDQWKEEEKEEGEEGKCRIREGRIKEEDGPSRKNREDMTLRKMGRLGRKTRRNFLEVRNLGDYA